VALESATTTWAALALDHLWLAFMARNYMRVLSK
jgi:hypothetical protein